MDVLFDDDLVESVIIHQMDYRAVNGKKSNSIGNESFQKMFEVKVSVVTKNVFLYEAIIHILKNNSNFARSVHNQKR